LKNQETKYFPHGNPFHIIALKDGRFALGLEEKGIAILDSKSLKILFLIKSPCIYFIEMKNGNLAAITSDNKIAVIKLKQDNYQILQTIDIGLFNMLGQLWNGTLIGCSKGEIIFFQKN